MGDSMISRASPKIEQTTGTSDSNVMSQNAVTSELNNKISANETISAGTATKIAYDSKGLVTSGTNLALSDIPSSSTANRILRVGTANSTPAYSQVALTTDVTGTLPVANGGTGVSSFTENSAVISGTTSTSALTTKSISDSTSPSAFSSSSTNLVTERDCYHAIPTINDIRPNSATSIYVPTTPGFPGNILTSTGSSNPSWQVMSQNYAPIDWTNAGISTLDDIRNYCIRTGFAAFNTPVWLLTEVSSIAFYSDTFPGEAVSSDFSDPRITKGAFFWSSREIDISGKKIVTNYVNIMNLSVFSNTFTAAANSYVYFGLNLPIVFNAINPHQDKLIIPAIFNYFKTAQSGNCGSLGTFFNPALKITNFDITTTPIGTTPIFVGMSFTSGAYDFYNFIFKLPDALVTTYGYFRYDFNLEMIINSDTFN